MNRPRISKLHFPRLIAAALALVVAAGFGAQAQAQTCAAPIPIFVFSPSNGNSCGNNNIPYVANGMLSMFGPDIVYKFSPFVTLNSKTFTLVPSTGLDLSLSLCPGSCSASVACLAIADSAGAGGTETITLPSVPPGDYYVIVDSANMSTPSCGAYTLTITGTLDDRPIVQ